MVLWTNNIDEAITAIKRNIVEQPTCSICSNILPLVNRNGEYTYNKGCSILHSREASNLSKYGVENVFQSEIIKDKIERKIEKTCLARYGVSNVMFGSNIMARSQNKNIFKRKEYKWKTGEISLVHGYEPIVLKELEEYGYKFSEVITSTKHMPKIMYQLDEKEHRYYPDIFIPKDNIIIEVKSDYTLGWIRTRLIF